MKGCWIAAIKKKWASDESRTSRARGSGPSRGRRGRLLRARAQSSDPAAADTLFRKGREAAEKGDWATACPKFAESQRLDPAPGTLLNLADCEEHLGQLASAYEHFKTALETMAPNDDRIPFAKQHMAQVEKRVPHLTLNASADLPASARVTKDDVQLGSASFGLALPVDPGAHSIVVVVAGHADRRVTVTLKAGDAQAIALRGGGRRRRLRSRRSPSPRRRRRSRRRTAKAQPRERISKRTHRTRPRRGGDRRDRRRERSQALSCSGRSRSSTTRRTAIP